MAVESLKAVVQGAFLVGEWRGGEKQAFATIDKASGRAINRTSVVAALEVSVGNRPQQVSAYLPETLDLALFKKGDIVQCSISKFVTEKGATKAYCSSCVKVG